MTDYAKTADQALVLLASIANDGPGSAATLGRRLGLNRAATHRLLKTVVRRGFVRRDAAGEYVLGPALFEVSTRVEPELRHLARPALERLAERFGETAVLAVPDRDDAVVFDQAPGEHSVVRIRYRPGFRHPLYMAAHGRAILAFMEAGAIERALADHPEAELARECLEGIRRLGYAVSSDEIQKGIRGLAAPVRDPAGRVVGSIGVVAPTFRFPPTRYLAPAIYEVVATVGMALEWRQDAREPGGDRLLRVT